YSASQVSRLDVSIADTKSGTIYVDDVTVGTATSDLDPFTSYTDGLNPIYHVGLSTATSSDSTWNDYHYIGQEFIPEEATLTGVKLPLHLSSGKATLHMEIRSTINGTALASTDVQLQSKGNSMQWYDIALKDALTLTPKRVYYFVYYLTARDSSSVCIAYGQDVGQNKATHYGYAWAMASGGTPMLTSQYNHLQFGFQLLTEPIVTQEELDKAAAKVVQDQIAALNVQTLDDKASVQAARKAYNALTSAQKEYVTNLSKLTSAESKIAELEKAEADKAAAKVVQNQIAALNVQSLDDKASVQAARKAYNALTSAQKAYVTNLSALEAAEAEILRLEQLPLYGDVDGDGNITAADALEVLKAVVGNVTLTADQQTIADVDCNQRLSSVDALYILKKVVGKIDQFPAEA
ncbi:MAG: dockerin type I repeat-containing protein, partial [Clostridia bacterium]|nr:dockerin type I repeat-containing protein [Clostridia bacterium]